jgi:hypothetical protein
LQVQLPVLYYPKLLDVEIDGQEVACVPLPWHTYLLAGVQLAPGPHDVRVRFRGLPWATRTSALAWAATLGGLAVALVARRRVVNS